MKFIKNTILLTLCLAGALSAQAQQRLYAVVDYMHLGEGQSSEQYLALEKLWQRMHQKAVDTGLCRGWYLSRVENGGRNQFVTLRVYDSLEKMAEPWPDSLRAGLYNSEETARMKQTGQTRTLTQSELWQFEAFAMGDDKKPLPVVVHFMKATPGKENDYFNMERNLYAKIQKARVDAGQMKSWFFLSRLFPSGADATYDFVTVNGYPEKGPSWDRKTDEAAVTKEEWAAMPRIFDLRTNVRQEIWHPVLRATAAEKK